MRPVRFGVALVIWLLAGISHAADTISILLSERGGAYAEVAEALRKELPPGVRVAETVADAATAEPVPPRLIIAVGTQACSAAARAPGNAPVLCTLIPRAAFDRATADTGGKGRAVTAVVLDQPPQRQMALIRLMLPAAESVAMLIGPESAASENALAAAASRHGLRAIVARTEGQDDLAPAIQKALDARGDALLAVPDSRVFNASTAQNILRAAIRARTPLFAFSPAYVRAGALAAVYSTPEQNGRQAGRLARDFLAGRALPLPQAPREFSVTVNGPVARSFGLAVPDESSLVERLQKLETSQ